MKQLPYYQIVRFWKDNIYSLNVFLPIINWLNQQRHGGNGRLLKSKRRSKYGTYAYFPVKQSHLSNV